MLAGTRFLAALLGTRVLSVQVRIYRNVSKILAGTIFHPFKLPMLVTCVADGIIFARVRESFGGKAAILSPLPRARKFQVSLSNSPHGPHGFAAPLPELCLPR